MQIVQDEINWGIQHELIVFGQYLLNDQLIPNNLPNCWIMSSSTTWALFSRSVDDFKRGTMPSRSSSSLASLISAGTSLSSLSSADSDELIISSLNISNISVDSLEFMDWFADCMVSLSSLLKFPKSCCEGKIFITIFSRYLAIFSCIMCISILQLTQILRA